MFKSIEEGGKRRLKFYPKMLKYWYGDQTSIIERYPEKDWKESKV